MFRKGVRQLGLDARCRPVVRVPAPATSVSRTSVFVTSFGDRISVRAAAILIVGTALLAFPSGMLAQRGGGGGGRGMMGTGVGTGAGRPDGISEKDDLKDFHQAMAVQATDDQRSAFARIAQYTQLAVDQLHAFRKSLQIMPASSPLADPATILDQAVEKASASSQNFLASFSSAQKSGLQDITKKLEKADADLNRQLKALDLVVRGLKPESEQIANSSSNLEKELDGFQSEQLALGREMGILFPSDGQGVTFNLPRVTNAIIVAGQALSIPTSGVASRISSAPPAENVTHVFSLKLVADLSDLQQNVTSILRSELTRSPRCGERISVQQATLTPLVPASIIVAHLHFERWVCPPGPGQGNPTEVADNEAVLEVKLIPSVQSGSVGSGAGLSLASEMSRVDAQGFLRDSLRSGDLGITLREQIAASMLSALQKIADPKNVLPPAAQQSATLQKAQFDDSGADQLVLILDGQLHFSAEQENQFAAQLKQRLSAQGTSNSTP